MANIEDSFKTTTSNLIRRNRGIHKYNSTKKINLYKSRYFNNNNILNDTCSNELGSISRQRDSRSNNRSTNYKKELFKKFYYFLKKKKFKISKKFNAKNSQKFLEKKDKCLERIILSDIIENDNDLNYKKKYETQKNLNNYYIIVTNYDEELKNNNNRKILNKTKTHIN